MTLSNSELEYCPHDHEDRIVFMSQFMYQEIEVTDRWVGRLKGNLTPSLLYNIDQEPDRYIDFELKIPPMELRLYSGSLLNIMSPDPNVITVADIVQGCANESRYGGQTTLPLSIAQHQLIVERILQDMGADEEVCFQGLVHDTPEFILKDMPKPIKRYLPFYHQLEDGMWNAVVSVFERELGRSLDRKLHPLVKEADIEAVTQEKAFIRETDAKSIEQFMTPQQAAKAYRERLHHYFQILE